ncbi:enoyl-CoA hydratase/isomerase family protein [Jatrophihabitans sp. DSM 45814]
MSAHELFVTDPDQLAQLELAIDDAGVPQQPVVIVDGDRFIGAQSEPIADLLRRTLPVTVLVGTDSALPDALVRAADLVIARPGVCKAAIDAEDPRAQAMYFAGKVSASPRASLTLSWLLRGSERLDVSSALAAESAAYSMLLSSADFLSWLAARPQRRPPDGGERVRVGRAGDVLTITLARSRRRNAVDTYMRHALLEALRIAELDDQLSIEIDAEGPSFSAGGDLDEFGTASDPAVAHLIRVSASVGQLIHDLRERVQVRVHGACIGAGIELPAFAGRVVAAPDAVFGLPEVEMGLIPGAGGTVSIPRRIGRGRTLWMAVTGEHVDAVTALRWGLIDALS